MTVLDASFDTSSNLFTVEWELSADSLTGYEYGITAAPGKTSGNRPAQWTVVSEPVMTGTLLEQDRMSFDTSYTVAVWLRRKVGVDTVYVDPAASAQREVQVGSFGWQRVQYFPQDTVYSANRQIVLADPTGKVGKNNMDTLRSYVPDSATVSGMVPAGYAFRFLRAEQGPPFIIGIRIRDLPGNVDARQTRMYRDSSGSLLVERNSWVEKGYVWVKTNLLREPFLALVDTTVPQSGFDPAVTNLDSVLPGAVPALYKGWTSDNISNVRRRLEYCRGDMGFSADRSDSTIARAGVDQFSLTVPASVVSRSYGLRARLIVDDGVHFDTLDVSRRVRCVDISAITTPPGQWVPVSVAADMDEKHLAKALHSLSGGDGQWSYDKSRFRVFNWSDTGTHTRSWVEYAAHREPQFEFSSTRLLWLKTAHREVIRFVNGSTLPLREPATVVLKARNWTDFATPFQFSIRFRDLAEANRDVIDSLQFNHWIEDRDAYVATDLFRKGIPSLEAHADTMIMEYAVLRNGYTVYNYTNRDIVLKIPPVSREMSSSSGLRRRLAPSENMWDLWLMWRRDLPDAHTTRIRCGYDPDATQSQPLYSPLPPSFQPFGAGVLDTSSNVLCGHVMERVMHDGGLNWKILFYNNGTSPHTLCYRLDNLAALPGNLSVLYQREDGVPLEVVDAWQTLELAPGSQLTHHLLVGNADFVKAQQVRAARPSRSGLVGRVVQSPDGAIAIRYSRSADQAGTLQLSLHDVRGRSVWSVSLNDTRLQSGPGHLIVDRRAVPAPGCYVLRMSALDRAGRSVSLDTRAITLTR